MYVGPSILSCLWQETFIHIALFPLDFLFSIQSIWDQNSIHINQHAYAKQDQPIYMSYSENENGYSEEKADRCWSMVGLTGRKGTYVCHTKDRKKKTETLCDGGFSRSLCSAPLPPSPFHAHYLLKKSLYQKFIIIFICAQLSKAWTEVCSGFIIKILTHIMSMVSF